jgi:hypothetical protein
MINGSAPELERARLEPLRRVGDGGQGVVFFTNAVKINKTWPVAYKEYLPQTVFNAQMLREMVAFVPQLTGDNGRWLCDNTSWPAALVSHGGTVTGFLMRRIPDQFRRPWGEGGADVPAALQYLLNPPAYLRRKNIVLEDRTRLFLLACIADTMARLHSLGIVVGDVSPNNMLVDLSASPRCFFIDCDAMRLHGSDVLQQVETPEWQVPRPALEPIATRASDAYKFGLLAVRLFAQDQMGRDRSALASVSPALADLARRSLDTNSTIRPAPEDWLRTLRAAAAAPVTRTYAPVTVTIPPPKPARRPAMAVPSAAPAPSPTRSPGSKVAAVVLAVIALIVLIAIFA